MLVDTHCHLNFERYDEDRGAVIKRAKEATVIQIINPAIDLESSRAGIALHQQYSCVFAAVGIHPNSSANFSAEDLAQIKALAAEEGVVAVGEIGLDYYWEKSPKETQIAAFEAQLALAAQLELPVIIHNREASDDLIAVLETWARDLPPALKERPGVLHSFSATPAIAERALAAGFYLGFTGPITFKKAEETRAVAAQAPLDRLLVETDGPFLTPEPFRGKRNEPAYIPYIVERLALIKGISVEDMGRATTENAARLFKLPS